MFKDIDSNYTRPSTRRSDQRLSFNFTGKDPKESSNSISNLIRSKVTTSRSYATKIQYKKARQIKRATKSIISPKISPIRKVINNSRSNELLDKGSSFTNIFQSYPDLKIEYEDEPKIKDAKYHLRHYSQEELLNVLSPEGPKVFSPSPNNTSFQRASFYSSPERQKSSNLATLEMKYQESRCKIKRLEEGYKELLYVFHKSEDENRRVIASLQKDLKSKSEIAGSSKSKSLLISSPQSVSDSKSTEGNVSYWLNNILRELKSMNRRISRIENHINIPK